MAAIPPNRGIAPLKVEFEAEVELTIHSAFLQTALLLQCDPVAQVSIVSRRKVITKATSLANGSTSGGSRTSPAVGGVTATASTDIVEKETYVASTRRLFFTSRPNFNETLKFVVPCAETIPEKSAALALQLKANGAMGPEEPDTYTIVERRILVTLLDAHGQMLGQATCPFSLYSPSASAEPQRVMLQPRHKHDARNPTFRADVAILAKNGVDDFGFVTVSWRVSLIPHGGALISASQTSVSVPNFPLGVVLRAMWLVAGQTFQHGTRYTTSVEFGGQDRFVFEGSKPLFLTIQSATQLERAIVHCSLHNPVSQADSHDVAIPLPMPPTASFAMERDVWWTAAVRTPAGDDFGLLLACIRIVRQPLDGNSPPCPDSCCSNINDPTHQAQYSHVAKDWGRAPPDTPPGAYQPLFWESEQHIARAVERRWRRDCVSNALPSAEHVRHLLEVLAGRARLDAGVESVVSVFFGQPPNTLTELQLGQFLVSCAFHAKGMTSQEAARFCFFALRRDMEQAIKKEDVAFILEHSLLEKTIDMPERELRRRVDDIFGDTIYVLFDDFVRHFINNYAMWYAFGVSIAAGSSRLPRIGTDGASVTHANDSLSGSGAAHHKNQLAKESATHDERAVAAQVLTEAEVTPGALQKDDEVWCRFIARVQHSNKAFSVTAHMDDTIAEVMVMVQNSTGIRAACQEWKVNGVTLEPKVRIASTPLGRATREDATPEVIIVERDETVRLVMVHKEKGMRWELRVPATERILKLRALVQQKTLIPLSRCSMRARGILLQDRHPLLHYKLQDGDIVEVAQE